MSNDLISRPNHQISALRHTADLARNLVKDSERLDAIETAMRQAGDGCDGQEKIQALRQALERFDSFVASELPAIHSNVEAAAVPSLPAERAAAVAWLIGQNFRHDPQVDRSISLASLAEFLEDYEPQRGQLGLALRLLVRTHDWFPTIAQVRNALINADELIRAIDHRAFGDIHAVLMFGDDEAGTGRAVHSIYGSRSGVKYRLEKAEWDALPEDEQIRILAEQMRQAQEKDERERQARKDREQAREQARKDREWNAYCDRLSK